MKQDFGLDTVGSARAAVELFVTSKLYPTETPDFEVRVLGFTGLSTTDDWRGYFTTDLPDDMLYEVVKPRNAVEPTVTAYKKEDI